MDKIKTAIDREIRRQLQEKPQNNKEKEPTKQTSAEIHPGEYDFTHSYRGLAVVISNGQFSPAWLGPREYDLTEIEMMVQTFSSLGFLVLSFQNLKVSQIKAVLRYISSLRIIHENSDAFACSIGTHGEEIMDDSGKFYQHVIYGTDTWIKTRDILKIFDDRNCRPLRGKPRLFFIQACRGRVGADQDKFDYGGSVPVSTGQSIPTAPKCRREEDCIDNETDGEAPSTNKHSPTQDKTEGDITKSERDRDLNDSNSDDSLELVEVEVTMKALNADQEEGGMLTRIFTGKTKRKHREGIYVEEKCDVEEQPMILTTQVPCPNHFLLLYATSSGKLALGRKGEGGWMLKYVSEIIEHYTEKRKDIDLVEAVTDVASSVAIEMESSTDNPSTSGLKTAVCMEHRLSRNIVIRND